MKGLRSIRYRIMCMTFVLVLLTVSSLVLLANQQMEQLFQEYLQVQPAVMSEMDMGAPEHMFLMSVHRSLLWVGLFFVLAGLVLSYILARNITIPLRQLSHAAECIRKGMLGQTVTVHTQDEVGQLALVFNQMSVELARNEKMRREFLANIAHELRTPLAILQGNLDNMIDGVAQPDMERLFSLQEEVMRLNRLVSDLRDLSLAEVHELELYRRPTDLNQLLTGAAGMLEPLLEEKGLHFVYDLQESLPLMSVDPDRIRQVFYNVLVNAVRYTSPDTGIRLRSWLADGEVWIEVQDEGPGVAAEELPRLFDHFYRTDKSRSRQSGGSGIGLSLARQFMEVHGGTIAAHNCSSGGLSICMGFGKPGR